MNKTNETYALDGTNAKLMGVCSGLARWTGTDATFVRLALVLATLVAGPVAILLYLLTGLIAPRA